MEKEIIGSGKTSADFPPDCPVCGAPNPEKNRICQKCGTYIGEPCRVSTAERENPLPSWDTPLDDTSLVSEILSDIKSDDKDDGIRDILETSAIKHAPAATVSAEPGKDDSFSIKSLQNSDFFTFVLLIFSVLFSFIPNDGSDGMRGIIFVFTFLLGYILYSLHKRNHFRFPNWFLWIFELLFTGAYIFLFFFGRTMSDGMILAGMVFFLLFIIFGIILKARN